jgi:gamma-glutamyltranspeptidase/glutathione hydrolase
MQDVLAPAIRLAEEGFPVSPITAYAWKRGAERQLSQSPGGIELTIEGRAPRPGELFRNPGLSKTLQLVAQDGSEGFYQGEIAIAIADAIQGSGGVLSTDDLASHQSTWDQPISSTYRGIRVWECPPNGQGLTALLALNILEGFEISAMEPLGPERLHLLIEALRLAFADAVWYIADPEFNPAPLQELLSKDYAAERRRFIQPENATIDHVHGSPGSLSNTVYLTAADGFGNACSFINSNYMGFGTGIVPRGWGFSLQNRGHNFSLDPEHPNVIAPNALDRPRVYLRGGDSSGIVAIEEGTPVKSIGQLADWGHNVELIHGYERGIFGRGQIIYRDPGSSVLWGGSDPRADGHAAALV